MRMRCQHEVYFQPKMFETIGFHHQGNYNITAQLYSLNDDNKSKNYAYPFLNRKRTLTDLFEDYETDKVNTQKLDYQTKKFDISFNEQEFIFNGGCKFKIETDVAMISNIAKTLYLELKLVKYNGVGLKCNTTKDGKAMFSTENMIKTTLDDQKDASHDKIQQNEKQNKKQKEIKKKPVETVTTVTLQIDPSTQNMCQSGSIFQTIVFSQQPYFGKLYFMVSHVKIGYKVRNKQITLPEFAAFSRSSTQSNTRDSISLKLKLNFKDKQQLQHRESFSENGDQQVLTIFEKVFHSPCVMFEHVVRQQIVQLNRMTEIESELTGLEDKQAHVMLNQKKRHIIEQFQQSLSKKYNSLSKPASPPILINVPQKDSLCFQSDLLSYYQCEGQQDLIKVIYEQSYNLSTLIASKWQDVVVLMGKQKWCALYYHKTLTNFKSQITHLSKHFITDGLHKFSQQKLVPATQAIPSDLKYKFYIHHSLPRIFMQKSNNNSLSSLSKMSSQHILFVLVHGFNGNQQDMSRAKSFISYFCTPHFLVLKKISQKILQNIEEIGKVASEEIKQFLKTKPFIKRVNFVGFSLGGVIIRAALPFLKQHQPLFNMLLTLSSPHLGVKQIKSCIVKTGMHVLHKIRGAKNIHELLLGRSNKTSPTEEQQLEQISTQISYLQKLANDQTIKAFKLVVFCGSHEDKYVPGFSAILDYQGEDSQISNMQKDLKKNIRNLHQICVKFDQNKKGTSWDRIIGRRIHINFLDDDSFLYFLLAQYFHIF